MHWELSQLSPRMGGKARTNFSLPTLTTIAALRRANLLDLHLIAIATGNAGLSAVCSSVFSHCSGSYSREETKRMETAARDRTQGSQSCAIVQCHRGESETRRLQDSRSRPEDVEVGQNISGRRGKPTVRPHRYRRWTRGLTSGMFRE